MLLAVALLVSGIAATAWGVTTAVGAPRPQSLGGGLVAAIGLACAMAGVTRLLIPTFF